MKSSKFMRKAVKGINSNNEFEKSRAERAQKNLKEMAKLYDREKGK